MGRNYRLLCGQDVEGRVAFRYLLGGRAIAQKTSAEDWKPTPTRNLLNRTDGANNHFTL